MNNSWNEFRKEYKNTHGTTSSAELSAAYKKHMAKGHKSVKSPRSPRAPAAPKSPKSVRSPRIREVIAHMPATRKYKINKLRSEEKHEGEGRGSKNRGWLGEFPQKGHERHELLEKCGKSAFLQPEREGYPVKAALRNGEHCAINCKGVTSAKVRACQFHQYDVAQKAQNLGEKHCGFKHASPCKAMSNRPH
jgi:hypothetical protein